MENNIKNELNPSLTFEVLHQKALEFANGDITAEQIGEWGQALNIRTSLPIKEKLAILMGIISEQSYTDYDTQEILVCELYVKIFFKLYLAYLGIAVVPDDETTFDVYDLMEPLYGPWIESYSLRDINMFKDMLRDALNFYNVSNMTAAIESVDTQQIDEAVKSNEAMVRYLANHKDLIRDLREIAGFENPVLHDIVAKLGDEQ